MHRSHHPIIKARKQVVLTLALALILVTSTCSPPEPAGNPVNVLLISFDTLRPDHLSCYGYTRQTSPNLDAIAQRGVLFENFYSSTSWTLPAHMAMFTGLPDSVHGVYDNDVPALDPNRKTLAQQFKAAGYTTAGFVTGPYLHPAFGFDRGFDEYFNCMAYMEAQDFRDRRFRRFSNNTHAESHRAATNPTLFSAATNWLQQKRTEPFFLFMHVWDVHYDFTPPPPFDRKFDPDYNGPITGMNFASSPDIHPAMAKRDLDHLIALYDGEIAYTDEFVGKLMSQMDRLGLTENTLIVITADHGEEFFEHGRKGHQWTLFEEVLRIPLIISWPGHLPQGKRVTEQGRIIDLVATLTELCSLPPNTETIGTSLVAAIEGTGGRDLPVYSELDVADHPVSLRAIRTPEYKLIWDNRSQRFQLFDMQLDPQETNPLPAESIHAARALASLQDWMGRMKELAATLPRHSGRAPVDLDDQTLRRLKGLGYISD